MSQKTDELKEHLRIVEKAEEILAVMPNCCYLIQPEVGDMPKDKVRDYCYRLREVLLTKLPQDSFVIIPMMNGVGKINLLEIQNEVIQYEEN